MLESSYQLESCLEAVHYSVELTQKLMEKPVNLETLEEINNTWNLREERHKDIETLKKFKTNLFCKAHYSGTTVIAVVTQDSA